MPRPTDSQIIQWKNDYNGADTNVPQGSDIVGSWLDDQLRIIKNVVRAESVNKQWERWAGLYGTLTPVDGTHFMLSGDQRLASGGPCQPGRRIKATLAGGTVYGYIIMDAFSGTDTTVTVIMDSTPLDGTLSEVQFGSNTFTQGGGLPVPYAKVKRTTTQSIADSTRTAITYDTVVFTNASTFLFDIATPTRLKMPLVGTYLIGGSVAFALNATGIRGAGIGINGDLSPATGLICATDLQAPPTFASALTISTSYYNSTIGTYAEFGVLQASGGALNTAADNFSATFWIAYLIP